MPPCLADTPALEDHVLDSRSAEFVAYGQARLSGAHNDDVTMLHSANPALRLAADTMRKHLPTWKDRHSRKAVTTPSIAQWAAQTHGFESMRSMHVLPELRRTMIELDDRRWEALRGAYGLPYDPRPVLRRLKAGCATEPDWEELWSQLHHQGDVGEASYASAPQLIAIQAESEGVDWNVYAMLSTIEIERHRRANPPLPEWLAGDYRTAWRELPRIAARDLLRTDDPLALRANPRCTGACQRPV